MKIDVHGLNTIRKIPATPNTVLPRKKQVKFNTTSYPAFSYTRLYQLWLYLLLFLLFSASADIMQHPL